MKKIHVIATSNRRILTIAYMSEIPKLLKKDEQIKAEWFYNKPAELSEFLKTNPKLLKKFLQEFSNWIEFRVKGYAKIKKTIQNLKKKIKKSIKT